VADKHLGSVSLDFAGFIPKDDNLPKSVRQQRAVIDAYPSSEASKGFEQLAKTIIRSHVDTQLNGSIRFFWKRLLRI
jgi:flagellar biosynthesis protein FlhG